MTIVFFLIVNLNYFWEGKLGVLTFLIFIFLTITFLFLSIVMVILVIKGINEKFANQNRNWTIGIMAGCLGLFLLKPNGIINFDKLEGEDLFIAQRKGAGNCVITFKIKPNHKFKERNICFGVSEVKGKYEIRNDTIFFSEVILPIGVKKYYEYGILQKSKYRDGNALFRYRDQSDTIGQEIWITKNELLKFKTEKTERKIKSAPD